MDGRAAGETLMLLSANACARTEWACIEYAATWPNMWPLPLPDSTAGSRHAGLRRCTGEARGGHRWASVRAVFWDLRKDEG